MTTSSLSVNDQLKLSRLDAEILLRGQLLDAELQLDCKRSSSHVCMTKKRRKKLESKVQALRRKLALQGLSLVEQVTMSVATTTVDDDEPDRENPSEGSRISREEKDMLLASIG
jgi:hypothetical protein